MSALLCNKSSNYGKNMTAITGIISDAPDTVVCSNVYRLSVSPSVSLPGGGGGETPHMKVVGMLVVSLRGVNFGFWSHLGCSAQSYLAVKVSFRVAREKI